MIGRSARWAASLSASRTPKGARVETFRPRGLVIVTRIVVAASLVVVANATVVSAQPDGTVGGGVRLGPVASEPVPVLDGASVQGAGLQPAAVGDLRLDTSWSRDGIAGLTPNRYRVALSAQDSGRLFTASYTSTDAGAMRLTRYEADGSVGTSFGGGDGVLQRRFAPGTNAISFPSHIIRTGDKFVVVGDHYSGVERLGIARLSTSGAYDSTFSGDGRVLHRIFPREHDLLEPWKVQVLDGGKIAIAIAAFDRNSNNDFIFIEQALVRLNANGSLDTTFSGDGLAIVDDATSDVTFLPNGGYYAGRDLGSSHEVRKGLPSAGPDTSFSGDGRTTIATGDHISAALQVDLAGRPLLAVSRTGPPRWLLVRWTTSGLLDADYGSGDGQAELSLSILSNTAAGFLIDMQPDGTFWLLMQSAADSSWLEVRTVGADGNTNAGVHPGLVALIDLPFTANLNRMAVGGGRVWAALQKLPTVTALVALAPET